MPNIAKFLSSRRPEKRPEVSGMGASKSKTSMLRGCSEMVFACNTAESKMLQGTSSDSVHKERLQRFLSEGPLDRSKHLCSKGKRVPLGELRNDHSANQVSKEKRMPKEQRSNDHSKRSDSSVSKEKCRLEGESQDDHSMRSNSSVSEDKCTLAGGERPDYLVINDKFGIPGGLRRVPLLKPPSESSLLSRRMKATSKDSKGTIQECNMSVCTTVPESSDREFPTPEGSQHDCFTSPRSSEDNDVQDMKLPAASELSKELSNRSHGYPKQPQSCAEAKRLSSWHASFFASRVENDGEDIELAPDASELSEERSDHSYGCPKQPRSCVEARRLSTWHSSFFAVSVDNKVNFDKGDIKKHHRYAAPQCEENADSIARILGEM